MSETFHPRGLGLNWIPCFICGREGPGGAAQPDCASFVDGKAGGERVVALFERRNLRAKLDYRENYPNRVQVKVGACVFHVEELEALIAKVVEAEGNLSVDMLPEGELSEEGWRIAELENHLDYAISILEGIKEYAEKKGEGDLGIVLHAVATMGPKMMADRYTPSRPWGNAEVTS